VWSIALFPVLLLLLLVFTVIDVVVCHWRVIVRQLLKGAVLLVTGAGLGWLGAAWWAASTLRL
jgi:hypothetical protein